MKIIRPNVTEDTIGEYERSLNIKFKDAHGTDFEKLDRAVNLGGITLLCFIALIVFGVLSIIGAVMGNLPTYAVPAFSVFWIFCFVLGGVAACYEEQEENLLLELENERSAWGFEPIHVCSMQDYRHLQNDRNNRPITFPIFDRLKHSLNEIKKFEAPEITEIDFCEYDNEWNAIYLFACSEEQPACTVGPITCDNEAFKTIYHDGSVSADFSYLDREFEFAKAKVEEMIARAQEKYK